eukprot:UN15867
MFTYPGRYPVSFLLDEQSYRDSTKTIECNVILRNDQKHY